MMSASRVILEQASSFAVILCTASPPRSFTSFKDDDGGGAEAKILKGRCAVKDLARLRSE